MKTVLRVLLGVGALLVLLVVALGAYLALVFDPNDHRERLGEVVSEHTGRPLKLPGELELSVFPWLGIRTGRAELGNAAGFSQRPFIVLDSAEARVRLMPLLKNEVVVDRIVLKGLALSLERSADGRSNWEGLGGGGSGRKDRRGAGESMDETAALDVGGVVIEDAVIVWEDAHTGAGYRLEDIDIEIGAMASGKPFEFDLAASFAATAAALEGRVSVSGKVTLDRVAQSYRVSDLLANVMVKGDVPGGAINAAAKGHVDGSSQRIAFEQLSVTLDDSTLSGRIEIADVAGQALRFDLSLDTLDVDRYLPPPLPESGGKRVGPAESAATGVAAAQAPPSLEALRGLDAAGRVRVGALRIAGMQARTIDVAVKAAGGRIEVTPTADLYDGRFDARVSLDARPRTPLLAVNGAVNDVHIGPLLRDLTGKPEQLTGRARVGFDVSGEGLTAALLKASLKGSVTLTARDGTIQGINVARYLREAQAMLSKQPMPAESEPNQTDFSDLAATLKLGGGFVSNDDLALRSPLLRVGGAGKADMVRERIDYRIRASLVGTLTGQGGKSLDKLKGVTVPILVTGRFSDPKYALEVDKLMSETAKGAVRSKIEEELQKGLRGLFK